jgi:hypothetical protein
VAFIDDDGWLKAEPDKGDVLRIARVPRPKDYGPLLVPHPVLISHHVTARWMKNGSNTFGPGMDEMGARACKADYYAHVYVARDGKAAQIVRYGRSALATERSVIVDGKKRETNRVAFQIEWDNWGVCFLNGWRGKDVEPVNPKRSDAIRNRGVKPYPGPLWQNVTDVQARAVAEICAAVVARSKMNPLDALHGHYELVRDGHIDPGPVICGALETVVAGALGLKLPMICPAREVYKPTPVVISTMGVA